MMSVKASYTNRDNFFGELWWNKFGNMVPTQTHLLHGHKCETICLENVIAGNNPVTVCVRKCEMSCLERGWRRVLYVMRAEDKSYYVTREKQRKHIREA